MDLDEYVEEIMFYLGMILFYQQMSWRFLFHSTSSVLNIYYQQCNIIDSPHTLFTGTAMCRPTGFLQLP